MNRRAFIIGAIAGALTNTIAWYLSGAAIFQRGTHAVGWFCLTLLCAVAGGVLGHVASEISAIEKPKTERPGMLTSETTRLASLETDVLELKSRLSALSLVAGLKPPKRE